jgi:glucose/arabinose dehydrogenase
MRRLAYGLFASILVSILACSLGCGDDSGSNPGDPDAPNTNGDGGNDVPDAAVQVGCDPVAGTPDLDLQMVGQGYSFPLAVTSPPGDSRLFVVEQGGTIEIIGGGTFLDIASLVDGIDFDGDESGLLGLAFHPSYGTNRLFYVYYVEDGGDNIIIAEFSAMAGNPDVADAASRRPVLTIPHGGGHHYGGGLTFGPGDYLYIGTGDGGFGGCDPMEYGQNTGVLLGKLLRIDPDTGSIPAGNPFGDEIWAVGLRNPWRFSFDSATGDLYIGDVGQGSWEEVNVVAGSQAGVNYGWDIYEADLCHDGGSCDGDNTAGSCDTAGKTFPVKKYNDGAAVIGGYVYRGGAMPALNGTYFYGDYGQGFVRSFRSCGGGAINDERNWSTISGQLGNISSFGQDSSGELYVVDHDSGRIYKIVAQ